MRVVRHMAAAVGLIACAVALLCCGAPPALASETDSHAGAGYFCFTESEAAPQQATRIQALNRHPGI
ncbi:MAG TPA: hypothetical protein VEH27_03075, partial [Methylomirabilota bacterium]|nr:hypothetical protein [Methylomirabilota bacterium]